MASGIDFFSSKSTYAWVLFFSWLGPLGFSFLPQLKFYKHWLRVFLSAGFVSCLFLPWDVYFTNIGVWGFRPEYTLGLYFFSLPLEEICFFIIIPFCSVFVYACIPAFSFFQKKWYAYTLPSWVCLLLGGLCWIGFWWVKEQAYTASVLGGGGLLWVGLGFRRVEKLLKIARFILAYVIVVLPFLVVNGILTALPVVWYNDMETMGWRWGSIPAEDFLYQGILFALNVMVFNVLTPLPNARR